MLAAAEIIKESENLEISGKKTVEHYMVYKWGIYWDENPELVELAVALNSLMQVVEEKSEFGYTMYSWWPK